MAFLEWVAEIPPETHPAYPETKVQLIRTFYYLTATYGLTLRHSGLSEFEEAAQASTMIRIPRLYLPCADRTGLFLSFDWSAWMRGSGYLMEP